MLAYPTTLPVEAFNTFLRAALPPHNVTAQQLAQATWEMSGYVLGMSVGTPPTLVGAIDPTQDVVTKLNDLSNQLNQAPLANAVGPPLAGFNMDWKLVIQALIALALQLLNKPKTP